MFCEYGPWSIWFFARNAFLGSDIDPKTVKPTFPPDWSSAYSWPDSTPERDKTLRVKRLSTLTFLKNLWKHVDLKAGVYMLEFDVVVIKKLNCIYMYVCLTTVSPQSWPVNLSWFQNLNISCILTNQRTVYSCDLNTYILEHFEMLPRRKRNIVTI